MKKNLLRILCSVICACILCLGLVGCGASNWKPSTLNNPGQLDSADYARAGFVAETENYIFYINGVANSSDSNTFGVPVKGALMAVDKTDLTSKTEVVVPKLFTSKNYEQGLFVSNGYVYYGTPSTDKTSSGAIATSDMVFTRSTLDGKATTEALYTVGSHSTDYRFVEKDGVVYIVYYDVDEASIVSVNTSTKETKTIIKTDAEVEVEQPVNGEYGESLKAYKFVGDKVVYSVTVYNEEYIEEKVEENNGSRSEASYNKIYLYRAGEEPELLLDGRENETSYEIKFVNDKSKTVFVKETRNTLTKTYAYQLGDAFTKGEEVNADYLVSSNIFEGDKVYTLSEGIVYVDDIQKGSIEKEVVAKCSTISSLLFIDGDELYYLNSSNNICKIQLGDEDAHEIIITENEVVANWYDPAIITLNQKDYLFYADHSSYGKDYVKYVELDDAKIVAEDTDDDGEVDKWAYAEDSSLFLGEILDGDYVSMFEATVNALNGQLESGAIVFDTDDDGEYVLDNGSLVWSALDKVLADYDELTDGAKSKVSSKTLEVISKYKKAVEMASLYNRLDGVREYKQGGASDEAEGARLEAVYNDVKAQLNAFENSGEFDSIKNYINNNFKHLFQTAKELFDAE